MVGMAMDAQSLALGAALGAATGWAHVATLKASLPLAAQGRVWTFAGLQMLRFAGLAALLVALARLGPPTLIGAALALVVTRRIVIARARSAA